MCSIQCTVSEIPQPGPALTHSELSTGPNPLPSDKAVPRPKAESPKDTESGNNPWHSPRLGSWANKTNPEWDSPLSRRDPGLTCPHRCQGPEGL